MIKDKIPSHSCGTTADFKPVSSMWSTFRTVTISDHSELVTRMKPSSCSSDVIPFRLFKKVFGPCVTKMVNLSLSTGVFPDAFKHAIVEPLLKREVWTRWI